MPAVPDWASAFPISRGSHRCGTREPVTRATVAERLHLAYCIPISVLANTPLGELFLTLRDALMVVDQCDCCFATWRRGNFTRLPGCGLKASAKRRLSRT